MLRDNIVLVGGLEAVAACCEALVCTQLRKLSSLRLRGTVSHSYTPHAIISCLQLTGHMKPQSEIKDVLAIAAGLLLGPEVHDVRVWGTENFEL